MTDQDDANAMVKAELWARVFVVFVLTVSVFSIGTLTYLAVQNRHTLHAIQDCTQPAGECYRRSQKQTAGAVGDINRVVILAAACASGLPDGMSTDDRQARIQTCVINRLAR